MEYPVFQKKPMRGMPLIWDAGVFSPERLPNMIQSFKSKDPDLLIFLKGDYIRAHYSLAVPATAQNFQYELWTPKS
jgi:hypothetical protein